MSNAWDQWAAQLLVNGACAEGALIDPASGAVWGKACANGKTFALSQYQLSLDDGAGGRMCMRNALDAG